MRRRGHEGRERCRSVALSARARVTLRQHCIAVTIALPALVACVGERTARPAPSIRDSAGVRIVEWPTLRNAPRIALVEPAYLRLGGQGERIEQELDPRATWMEPVQLSDGRIVVPDMQRLVFFDSTGAYQGSAGRRGNGPGEFQQVARVCRLPGDTLLSISENDRRVILWDSRGKHIRTFARPGPILLESCFPNGTLIAPTFDFYMPRDGDSAAALGVDGAPVEYVRLRADGTRVSSLGLHPSTRLAMDVTYYVQVSYAAGYLHVADPRRYEVRSYDTTAFRLKRIIRVTEPLPAVRAPTTEGRRGTRTAIVTRSAGGNAQRTLTEPAFGAVLVDDSGRLWIRHFREWNRCALFDSDGTLVGRLDLTDPALGWMPYVVGAFGDHVVIKHRDADGAGVLSFYRFRVTD